MTPSATAHRVLAPLAAGAAVLAAALWWAGERAPTPDAVTSVSRADHSTILTDEAIRLYASGQLARACDRFSEAAGERPESIARREDLGRCFETWGWRTLAQGRAEEAALLFGQGLAAIPDDPALLKGAGVAAVHAGRPDQALGSLEASAARRADRQVQMLLARLYDHRDEGTRAVAHLEALLAVNSDDADARSLLDKLERERRTEQRFVREAAGGFVLRYRNGLDAVRRGAIIDALGVARARVVAELGDPGLEPVTVVLYDRGQFSDATRSHAWVDGLFDGRIRLPITPTLPRRAQLERLLTHEYAHAVIHRRARGHAPRWLHEGLAQLLEGRVPHASRGSDGLTLAGLETLVADSDPHRAHAGYELALYVVGDLLERGGMESMRALLARLAAGETIEDAAPRVYGWQLMELESQWRRQLGGRV